MKLEEFYNLRQNFSIIGLTGRSNSGCSEIAQVLNANSTFFKEQIKEDIGETIDNDILKQRICNRFILAQGDLAYNIINYRDVLLLMLLKDSFFGLPFDDGFEKFCEIVTSLKFYFERGERKEKKTIRIDRGLDLDFFNHLRLYFIKNENIFNFLSKNNLATKESFLSKDFYNFYFNLFINFSEELVEKLNKFNYFKRTLFFHDLATRIRLCGSTFLDEKNFTSGQNVYSVVIVINWIIKSHKLHCGITSARYVIDSLKNSLELTYFKEKYSAFFMLSVNTFDQERWERNREKLSVFLGDDTASKEMFIKDLASLDEAEYKSKEVNSGIFASPDIENCIQKSDYHIFYSEKMCGSLDPFISKNYNDSAIDFNYSTLNKYTQISKFISLIFNPGLVTPTIIERTMQVAFTAKLSSGCISRQVGAVVTDENFSVKAIGWNDVAENQIPCNLRDVRDLRDNINTHHFSEFEKNEGTEISLNYKDGLSFKNKILDRYSIHADLDTLLDGKPCSYCFKSCHNDFENKENQVHTRSLHAEENAMLQISKYGGQALRKGYLFTTASPCELCAKKAFQLGLTRIYYIDPYPGISRFHTLTNGISEQHNPSLIMFQGAIGRGFLRLYQPFMAVKDELAIMTQVKFAVN